MDNTKKDPDTIYKAFSWSEYAQDYYPLNTKAGNGLYSTYTQAKKKIRGKGKVVQYTLTVLEEEIIS